MTDNELTRVIDSVVFTTPGRAFSAEHMRELEALFNRLPELLEAEATLQALRAAGVDGWDGYEMAMDML